MAVAGRASFEIQIYKNDHWVMHEMRETESQAQALAKQLLSNNKIAGVRILKNWMRSDGVETAREIFCQQREVKGDDKILPVPIDSAPYCSKTAEFYQMSSRVTVNRLLRRYIEQVYLTPTELMHSYSALQRVQEADSLFPAAVDRVATLQAKSSGEAPQERRDTVYRVIAQMTKRAQRAERHPNMPRLKDSDVKSVLSQAERIAPAGEAEFFALVALSQDLVQYRSWLGKLDRLADLGGPSAVQDPALPLIDRVLSDLITIPSALQDILGFQRNLGRALMAMADLTEGKFDAQRSDARDQLRVLEPLIAAGKLPETRLALLERLQYQLASAQPLNRHDPAMENDTFRAVVQRLYQGEHFLGGPATVAAITRRFSYTLEAGGMTGLRQSVRGLMTLFPDQLFQLIYLFDLAESDLGGDLGETIGAEIARIFKSGALDQILPAGRSQLDRLAQAGRLFTAMNRLTGLPAHILKPLIAELDRILAAYIVKTGLIDKLDAPGLPLRDRAIRLVEFCASQILPHGSMAMATARDRVITHLRQPNFDAHLIDGAKTRAEAERILRDFHGLLVRAGFQ